MTLLHTRIRYSGLAGPMRCSSMLFTMASIILRGTSGFVGEF